MLTDVREIALPVKTSSDQYWITWYDALRDSLSKKDAQTQFKLFWEQRGEGTDANTNGLREAMKDRGVIIEPDGIVGSIVDSASSIIDGVTDGIGSFLNVGKGIVYGGLGLTVLCIGVLLYSVAKRGVSASYMGAGVKV